MHRCCAGCNGRFGVLVSLLGVRVETAVNRASHTRRDWTSYIAERISARGPGCQPGVQAADFGGDGRDVDRHRVCPGALG
ncbi:MAG: hypothetical protein ACRDNW_27570 [Trebonia sp.]